MGEGTFVSRFLQKSIIEVKEKGTEAAAFSPLNALTGCPRPLCRHNTLCRRPPLLVRNQRRRRRSFAFCWESTKSYAVSSRPLGFKTILCLVNFNFKLKKDSYIIYLII